MANMLFNQGLFLGGDYYLITKYKMTYLVIQCFKCQDFNYIAKKGKKEARYGYCIR